MRAVCTLELLEVMSVQSLFAAGTPAVAVECWYRSGLLTSHLLTFFLLQVPSEGLQGGGGGGSLVGDAREVQEVL